MTNEPGTERAGAAPRVPADEPRAGLPLSIAVDCCARVNFAMQQNRTALVGSIAMTNGGADALEDVRVQVELANGEARPWEQTVGRIGPGETYTVEPRGLTLDAASLASRTERERTMLRVRVECGADSVEERRAIDLLPFDHWGGLWPCPEMLGAFVTPNHPSLGPVLSGAREALRARGERDAIDGYQSGSRTRAALLAEACFASLARSDLGYIAPPASFEREGQRVRLADRVLRERLGTCLDLSLLLAGLWEQAGLNPVVLLLEDHSLPAVWTHDEHLPEPVIDEVERVRKRVELGELVPVESTVLTHPERSFAGAVEGARRRLASAQHVCAVDIRTARRLGVRPLPLRVEPEGSTIAEEAVEALASGGLGTRLAPVELAERAEAAAAGDQAGSAPSDRVDRWKRKLLDLSLRNRLLNFRETNRSLELAAPDLAAIEDRLADGGALDVLPRPARAAGEAAPSAETEEAFRRSELAGGRMYATSAEAETAKKLLELYRAARSSIEETGANVLFLVLGMLHWYEAPGVETARRAPLILLPVTLVRRSAGGGYRYRIELTSEPLRPNITLLEKLKTDFGLDVRGLEELPEDERGLDVPLILRRFREAVRDVPRWDVVETAHLGLLSFNKFLMWHDLQQHRERLRGQRLVRHLIERGEDGAFESRPFADAATLDDELAPGELLCTRDADSSQLVAVRAAGEGRTFVLEGPPGTGKSQTIANIVADAVARGKRVLFVAEKMAALSVVRRRLEQDGLGPFCLELHSAKASKKEVLRQLGEALDAARAAEPAAWRGTCEGLAATRERLNEYVRELHAERASGESIYQVIGRLARLGDGARVDLRVDDYGALDASRLGAWRACVESLTAAAGAVDPVREHPLRGIGRGAWSFALPEEARRAVDDAAGSLDDLRAAIGECVRALAPAAAGLAESLSQPEVRSLCEAASRLAACPAPERELLRAPDIKGLGAGLGAWIERGREKDRRRAALLERYRPELHSLDLLALLDAARRALAKPAVLRWIFARGVRKRVRPVSLGAPGTLEGIARDLEEALAVNAMVRELAAPGIEPAACFGRRWKGGEADWDELASVLAWCVAYREALAPLASSARAGALHGALLEAATGAAPLSESALAAPCRTLVEEWNGWAATWRAARDLLGADGAAAWGAAEEEAWLGRARGALARWAGGLGKLNDWCRWRRECEGAVGEGLAPVVEAYESGAAARTELGRVFERSFGERWLVAAADASGAIRAFNARGHEEAIERFRRLDEELIRMTRLTVAARLAERLPGRGNGAAASSEVGILERERQKRSRHLPTRRLIELLPNLLPRLKPCFLMSPLSVAQYLDPHLPPFDLVVFDEASQIPVWDAIGAIARGSDVIVVGDSKQLPPTNFFNTLETGDEMDELATPEDDELESILQECNASGVPSLRLRWHYRSRHESLITFSNHHYYDDQLQTFPSPLERSAELGVTMRLVEGAVYDRGGTRTNRAEAERVVAEVLALLAEPGATGSIGIVTFNAQQQGLIEDMLDAARRERPEIERFFTEVEEPVFVKNLENVQGDERDTIIFSVGFGPDERGWISMNFGPLNADGGERRLNVAITRARSRLLVFSSMRGEAIDLSRTRAVGVRHFKRFLDYAERGPAAIAEASSAHREAMTPSELEQAVADALRGRGWEVDARVGCAGYRIDLAVRDAERPGRYMLGIECDGPMYRGASTARDRERTRHAVLEGLGWRLVRVWSTAWRLDAEGCVAGIEREIERARGERAGGGDGETKGAGGPSVVSVESRAGREVEGEAAPEERDTQWDEREASALVSPSEQGLTSGTRGESGARGESGVYRVAARPKGATAAADVFADRNTERAAGALAAVVEQEGPIVPELAMRRLAEWFGVTRITDRFRERFGEVLAAAGGAVVTRGDALWPAGVDADAFDAVRAAGEDEASQRDIEWIPLAERAAAVRRVLREQIGLAREDLEREAARLLGIARATTRTRELMGEAVDAVVAAGGAVEADGRVAIAE